MRRALRFLPLVAVAMALPGCQRHEQPQAPLVFFIERDVQGLDPHTSGSLHQTQEVLANLYEGLVALDGEMAVRPALAVSWRNPDERSWIFDLRPGVRFHGGETLTSADVVFSLERARTHPRSVLRSALANVVRIETDGVSRVRIATQEPDGFLLARLREAFVVSRRFVARRGEAALETASAGTGPYELVARRPGETVDVRRFEGYWGGPAAVPAARFVGRTFGEGGSERLVPPGSPVHFRAGTGVASVKEARLVAEESRSPSLSVVYVAFDLRDRCPPGVALSPGASGNPFLDGRVRKAVALAVDGQRLLAEGAEGIGRIPTQMVPPTVFGFDPSLPPPATDPVAARQLLAATPFRDGFDVDFDVREPMAALAAPLARDLAAVGIRARLNPLAEETFMSKVKSGESAMFLLRYSCRSGDAQELLDRAFRSRDAERGLGSAGFSYDVCPVAGLDATIDEARRTAEPLLRRALLQKALARIRLEALVVPVFNYVTLDFATHGVGWKPRGDGFRLAREAWLESASSSAPRGSARPPASRAAP